jgi:hypothetical protein
MLGNIEVISTKNLDDVCHSVFAEQHAAESTLLRKKIMRRSPFALPCFARVARRTKVCKRHAHESFRWLCRWVI